MYSTVHMHIFDSLGGPGAVTTPIILMTNSAATGSWHVGPFLHAAKEQDALTGADKPY